MLGEIDLNKPILKPQLTLCKPDRTEIAKIKHMSSLPQLKNNLGNVNELSFSIPFYVDINHKLTRYKVVDLIRYRYLIKFVLGNYTEYFLIDKLVDQGDETKIKQVHAYSLSYQLRDKNMRNYKVTSYTLSQLANDALSKTNWSLGYVDADFNNKYRSMDVSSQSVLAFLLDCASTFEALIDFDTIHKKVNFYKLSTYGTNGGLLFNYGKYLKQINNTIDGNNVFTRIIPHGDNDLSINGVNPTGLEYIDDFTPYIYPFERDENGNIINHSYYMNDDLCIAILDYNKLVEDNKDTFKNLLSQQKDIRDQLTTKQNEKTELETQLKQIQDTLDIQKKENWFSSFSYVYSGTSKNHNVKLDATNYYAIMIRVSSTTNLTVKIDNNTVSLSNNQWSITKIKNADTTNITLNGSATNVKVDIYIVDILDTEYNKSNNNIDILEKYNDKYKQDQIDSKQQEIDGIQSQLDDINQQIDDLRNLIDVKNNFTEEQLDELNNYVFEYEWTDTNYIDEQELYDDAVEQLKKLNAPPIVIDIDIVNFLEVVEAQRDWDKLKLGDYVTIKYDAFGINVEAQIIAIEYDFNSKAIKLTIANVKEVKNEQQKILDQLYSNRISSIAVDINKHNWDLSTDNANQINDLLNNTWDAAKRAITAGVNESVNISGRGIVITDSDDPNKMLIAQAGVLALSADGGANWRTAISADGIIAQQLIGQIIIGENLLIQNSAGKFSFDKDGATIQGTALSIIDDGNGISLDPTNGIVVSRSDKKVQTIMNAIDGIKIQNRNRATDNWKDAFYVDTNGKLTANGISVIGGTIDGSTFKSTVSGSSDYMTLDGGKLVFYAHNFDAGDGGFVTSANSDLTISPTLFRRNIYPSSNNNTGFDVDYEFALEPSKFWIHAERNNFGYSGGIVLDVSTMIPTIRADRGNLPNNLQQIQLDDVSLIHFAENQGLVEINYAFNDIGIHNDLGDVKIFADLVVEGTVTEGSSKDIKKNINLYEESALNKIKNTKIYSYLYKRYDDNKNKRIGVLYEESPMEIKNSKDKSVKLGDSIFMSWKAIQELSDEFDKKIDELTRENQILKKEIEMLKMSKS